MTFLRYALMALLLTLCQLTRAQQVEISAPKWAAKVQKSIVSVLTYDRNRQLLHSGTGVYIDSEGSVVAAYSLFRDAYSAAIVDASGHQHEVTAIAGADSDYGLVRCRTAARKTVALSPAPSTAAPTGTRVVALGFSKAKIEKCPASVVAKKDVVEGKYAYYTLASALADDATGHVLLDTDGQLLGLVLSPVGGKSQAIDCALGRDLTIEAIMKKGTQVALGNIHIRTALPDSKEEALVYLYFQQKTAGDEAYLAMTDEFVHRWPDHAEGYYKRALPLIDAHRFDDAQKDLQTYLRLAQDKAVANANVAQTIYSKLVYQPEPAYEPWNIDVAIRYVDAAIEAVQQKHQAATTDSLRQEAEAGTVEYKLQKAQMLMAKKDNRAAVAIYDEVNASPFRSAATFYAASIAHEAAGDSLDQQIAMMDSAMTFFYKPLPREAANYIMRRAQLLARAGQNRAAVLAFNDYAGIVGSDLNATFFYDRAILAGKARMYEQALQDIDRAIALEPRDAAFHVERASLCLRVNRIDDCIASAQQAIQIEPEASDAFRMLGYAQIQQGKKAEGIASLDRAIALGDEAAKEVKALFAK